MRTGMIAILALALTGCGVEVLTATAVQGELQAQQMTAMKRQIQTAAGNSGRINLERAISTYQAEKGAYPPSLDALAPNFIPAVPLKPDGTAYGYDPATGKLLETPAPVAASGGPTPQDQQMIQQIQVAINNYGQATGFYPASLDDLYPNYLSSPPRTASGEAFIYDNQNGFVGHPHQAKAAAGAPAAAAPPRANVPMGGGTGPMGEVMTGVGMQQQMNSMSQSGSSAAGGYAREKAGGTAGTHDAANSKAMDDLGL